MRGENLPTENANCQTAADSVLLTGGYIDNFHRQGFMSYGHLELKIKTNLVRKYMYRPRNT